MPVHSGGRRRQADAFWMAEVLAHAATGLKDGELPIAAIVVAGDDEVARARARDLTHGNRSSHAELLAITGARLTPVRNRGLSLYSILEPCVMCAAAALIEGFGRVVYSLSAPDDGGAFLLSDPLIRARCFDAPQPEVLTGILAAQAAALFADYVRLWPDHKGTVRFAQAVLAAACGQTDERSPHSDQGPDQAGCH